jgi:hypothetical protein
MKANAEPVRLPPVAIDAELSLSFAVRLRPWALHTFPPKLLALGGAGATISVGYARRHTDAFGDVVLANELSLVIAPIAGLLGALIGHGVAHTWRSRRIRPLPGVASVAFAPELS